MKIDYKKFLLVLVSLFLVILLGFLILDSRSNLKLNIKNKNAIMIDSIDQRLSYIFSKINNFPGSAANDLLFMSNLSCLSSQINTSNIDKSLVYCDMYADFSSFIKQNQAYLSLKLFSLEGRQLMSVNRLDNETLVGGKITPPSFFDDNFSEVKKLSKGEVYISPILLEELRYSSLTDSEIIRTPVMRYATPVYIDGEKKAVLVSDIDTNYFLEEIRRSTRIGEDIFMIDLNGKYLANKETEKEFSLEYNFFNDYPEIKKESLGDYNLKNKLTTSKIFSFKHIEPVKSNFAIYQASEHLLDRSEASRRHWILVSVAERGNELLPSSYLQSAYFWFVLLCSLIIAFTLLLFIFFQFYCKI